MAHRIAEDVRIGLIFHDDEEQRRCLGVGVVRLGRRAVLNGRALTEG